MRIISNHTCTVKVGGTGDLYDIAETFKEVVKAGIIPAIAVPVINNNGLDTSITFTWQTTT